MSDVIDYFYDKWEEKLREPTIKDPHDPKNFGGCWISIHILAKEAKTREEKIQNAAAIIKIMINLGCKMCVNHIKSWLKNNPVQATFDGDQYSLFDWTVKAHNYASSNAGNIPISLEQARKIWYEDKECKSNKCHGSVIQPLKFHHPRIRN